MTEVRTATVTGVATGGRRRLRRGAWTAALCGALLLAVAGCRPGNGPFVEGAAPAVARDALPVYVTDAVGAPLQRPERFAVSEFTSLTALTWESWGGPEATATGLVTGIWCLSECEGGGHRATVVLSGPVRAERVAYYGRLTVRADELPPELAAELDGMTLHTPVGQEDAP